MMIVISDSHPYSLVDEIINNKNLQKIISTNIKIKYDFLKETAFCIYFKYSEWLKLLIRNYIIYQEVKTGKKKKK